MKLLIILVVCVIASLSQAANVEEDYEKYKNNPNKILPPGSGIKSLDEFKSDWQRAQDWLAKYKTTEEAWAGYKTGFGVHAHFRPEEDAMRFQLFKPRYEELVKHNEKYARGEIYYPHWEEPNMHYTEAELEEIRKRPVH